MKIVQAIDNPNEKFTQTMAKANVCSECLIDLKNKLGKKSSI